MCLYNRLLIDCLGQCMDAINNYNKVTRLRKQLRQKRKRARGIERRVIIDFEAYIVAHVTQINERYEQLRVYLDLDI